MAVFRLTLGIYEVFLERSGRKIWVKPEPRAEPYIPCYVSRTKRSVVRAQRGRSEAEKSGFHFYILKFWAGYKKLFMRPRFSFLNTFQQKWSCLFVSFSRFYTVT